MKLKKHRDDVRDLRLMQDAHVQDIAKRYMNLIRMAEKQFNYLKEYKGQDGKPLEFLWPQEKRVLKDAEK